MKGRRQRGGETLMDAMMTYVLPVVGGAIGIIVVKRLTGWRPAFCVPVGLVAGVLASWGVFFGFMAGSDKISKTIKGKRTANQPSQPIAGKPGSG